MPPSYLISRHPTTPAHTHYTHQVRRNALVEVLPLSTGCLGACTYCKTKHARGELGSYDTEALVARVLEAVASGVREVWMSSEDTGAYGRDLGCSLADLLQAVLAVLPADGSCMLRVGMTNPPVGGCSPPSSPHLRYGRGGGRALAQAASREYLTRTLPI